MIAVVVIVFIPTLYSFVRYNTYIENSTTSSVEIISPAIDCYSEKYQMDLDWLTDRYFSLSRRAADPDFTIWPETAISDAGLLDGLSQNPHIQKIQGDLSENSKTLLVTGAIIYKRRGTLSNDNPELTFFEPLGEYLSVHNSALAIRPAGVPIIVRAKEIMVPFEETIPYPKVFEWVRSKVGTLGGFTFSSLDSTLGFVEHNGFKVTPLICYEILFGSKVSKLSLQNDFFFLLLNEGWYHSDTGSKQFLYYTSLRAVETRRAIARSSNVGFSAIIDQTGMIVKVVPKIWEPTQLTGLLNKASYNTFYSYSGDLVGQIAILCLFLIIVHLVVQIWRQKPS